MAVEKPLSKIPAYVTVLRSYSKIRKVKVQEVLETLPAITCFKHSPWSSTFTKMIRYRLTREVKDILVSHWKQRYIYTKTGYVCIQVTKKVC